MNRTTLPLLLLGGALLLAGQKVRGTDGEAVVSPAQPPRALAVEVTDRAPLDAAPMLESPLSEVELTPEMRRLRDKVRRALAIYYDDPESAERRSPWGVMHSLIGFGVDTQLLVNGRSVNAIGWLCWNGPCRGQRLLYTSRGELFARQGVGVEGHGGQFLSMLAQSRVPSDYGMRIDGRDYTVQDLIEHEQLSCEEGSELSFRLIAMAHYLPTNAQWKNRQGQRWDIPKLIHEELKQPVVGAACGGTHRMMGFSYAVANRRRSGEPMSGEWSRAEQYVEAYHEYTLSLQNRDGSFSSNWFAKPGNWGGADRKLETTGHILEWLVFSLPLERLEEPQVVRAVDYLAGLMGEHRSDDWEIGPLGHAVHALAIYDERVFGGTPGERATELAGYASRRRWR